MKQHTIYTIGHGNRKIEDFLSILKSLDIQYLIDVRSQPYSKFNPHFNQNLLKFSIEEKGINYVFMGDAIGGRPSDKSCYDDEGRIDYEVVKTKQFFLNGIDRLKTAYNKNISIVIMCSESNPCECHRSKLIGRVLFNDKIHLKHIDEKGKLKTQTDVINELNKGLPDTSLFPQEVVINSTSRKSYL